MSPLLRECAGVAHAFTARQGGVSVGAFASLNLSSRVGDDRQAVEENRRSVLRGLGVEGRSFVALNQVHGDAIVQVSRRAGRSIEADALWTDDPGAVLAILVADCVPILVAHRGGTMVAAAHAGWRGTVAGIAGKLVQRLKRAGFPPEELFVALGPAIGPCCFQIDDDTAAELAAAFPRAGTALGRDASQRAFADLWALNRQSLVAAGVNPDRIDTVAACTRCTETLFSFRRDAGTTGRQAAVIALRA